MSISAIDFIKNASNLLENTWAINLIFGSRAPAVRAFVEKVATYIDEPEEQERIAKWLRYTPLFSSNSGGHELEKEVHCPDSCGCEGALAAREILR